MHDDTIVLAAVQMACDPSDYEGNLERAAGFVANAARLGARFVCLPEIFDYGYELSGLRERMAATPSRTVSYLEHLSRKHTIAIGAGIAEMAEGVLFDSSVLVDPALDSPLVYRKIHLFHTPPIYEDRVFARGSSRAVATLDGNVVGMMICYDVRFPELARSLRLDGTHLILMPSAFPFPRKAAWETLNSARALENQVALVSANQVGSVNGTTFLGTSLISGPDGAVLAKSDETSEEVLVAELSVTAMAEHRKLIPMFDHRVPESYRLRS